MKRGFQVALFAMGLFSTVALAEPDTFGLGTGRDGSLVVTEAGRVVNSYTQMTGPAAPGDGVLLVEGTEGFGAGDLVLVFQATGLVPEPRPGVSGPIVLSDDPVGRWELARLAAVGNGTLTLKGPLVHSYAARVTQVIRIPEYTDVHVQRGASLRAVPWDGGTGGVVAFLATGTVRNDGEISATGAGFRGGRYAPDASDPERCMGMAVAARPGARKGEGVAVTQYGPMKTGRESGSNGGGGGVCPMAGGGGGGNGGPGGRGGWSADLGEGSLDIGGQGGAKLVHSTFERLIFGGGGGSGHGEDWSGPEGGAGGGVIFIRALELSGLGSIAADGEAGGSASVGGGSGGGAGGDILLRLVGSAECGSVSARGGAGGNTVGGFMGGGGPGGGGGGGRVFLLAGSSSDCLATSEAGLAGFSPGMHEVRSSGSGRGAQPTMEALAVHAGVVVRSQPVPVDASAKPPPPTVTSPVDGAFVNTERGFSIAGNASDAKKVSVSIYAEGEAGIHTTKEASVSSGSWILNVPPGGYADSAAFIEGGKYIIRVKAESGSGETSDSSQDVSFFVDWSAPGTRIDTKPPLLTKSTEATFTFSSTDSDVKGFECLLDDGAYTSCTSGQKYTGLGHGLHTFAVRAVDAAGNVDGSPATYSWTVDTEAPETSLSTKPPAVTSSTSATFTFSSTSSDVVGFECALNGGSFATCTSGVEYTGLAQGLRSFAVRAVDGAGNKDGSPATHSWTVDSNAPETSLGTKPPLLTNSTEATFSFSSNETGVTYQCSLDGGAYATCTSEKKYTGLSQGPHTFAVRAVDAAGNVDGSPATYSWTVDTEAPETSLGTKPPAVTSSTSATFTFSSTSSDVVGFECALNGGSFATCTSGVEYTGLAQGLRSFAVRAVDGAGNKDGSPATHSWTVDSNAPETSLGTKPPLLTNSTEATFSFSSNETGVTYQCSLDGGAYATCTSEKKYTGLSQGPHTFAVRAVDAAGNVDGSPATYSWTVDTEAPDVRIHVKPPVLANSKEATFTYSSTARDVERFECSLDDAAFKPCPSEGITYTRLADGSHSFSVQAVDKAGNGSPTRYNWIVDTIAPEVRELRPADGEMVNSQTPLITGRLEEPLSTVRVYIDGELAGDLLVDHSGSWSFRSPMHLANGPHTVSAEATDPAGNTGPRTPMQAFTVDTEPPDTHIVEGPPSTHNSRLAAFVFSSPNGATEFECQLDDAPDYTACGAESLFSGLANGTHKLRVRAKDPAGNVDPEPSVYEWYVLVELPRAPEILEPADGAEVNTRTPGISGTAVANGSVTVYINDKKSGVALVDESGHWIFRPPEPLEDGVYRMTAEATDVAGNTSEQHSLVRVFTVRYMEGEPLRSIGGGLSCTASGTGVSLSLLGVGGLILLSARRRHRR
ncbi:hypothetical protein JQX13_45715 [Archangium violaceum]|uniref:adventurous gliding motility protein AgmC n=1 Tax=Archangium violaceum TaxID=83451 RepID=UPI00193B7B48|nr:Ig-like domain-containing protein [Archangium violaceum]QRK07268.1 hypothetical protein JQX13_45715 [Archangium violaceum]